jgi:hypothetical protein
MELGTRRARHNSRRRTLARLSGAVVVAIASLSAVLQDWFTHFVGTTPYLTSTRPRTGKWS